MRSTLLILSLLTAIIVPLSVQAQDNEEGAEASEDSPNREVAAREDGQPRYLTTIASELRGLQVSELQCEAMDEQRGHCSFVMHGATTNRDFTAELIYSDRTDTVYLYMPEYIQAARSDEHTSRLLRRLMELNWELLLGKFEWDSSRGEVRLSVLLNTDSNFDRRAFRSAVRSLGILADRYHSELTRLQSSGSE